MDSSSPDDHEVTKAALEAAIRERYQERGCGCEPDFVWTIPDMAYPNQQCLMIYHASECVVARSSQAKWN